MKIKIDKDIAKAAIGIIAPIAADMLKKIILRLIDRKLKKR